MVTSTRNPPLPRKRSITKLPPCPSSQVALKDVCLIVPEGSKSPPVGTGSSIWIGAVVTFLPQVGGVAAISLIYTSQLPPVVIPDLTLVAV